MNVSKHEAVEALELIARTGDRMQTLRRYAGLAPFLLVWGTVWAGANVITDFMPDWSGRAWVGGSAIGVVISLLLGIRLGRRRGNSVERDAGRAARIRSLVMIGLTLCCYFPAMYAVLGALSARQANAFTSLTWAFAYMIAGAWVGWRLFTIGSIAVAAVVFGYLNIGQHYYLWMAACGGGTLIAGGLWLRRI